VTAPTLKEYGPLKSAIERLELISQRGDEARRLDQGEALELLEHIRKVSLAGVGVTKALAVLPPVMRVMVLAEAARILGK
jgi:hypothetical protein